MKKIQTAQIREKTTAYSKAIKNKKDAAMELEEQMTYYILPIYIYIYIYIYID